MSRPYLWAGINFFAIAFIVLFLAFIYPRGGDTGGNIVLASGAVVFILLGLLAVLKKEYGCKDAIRDIDFYFSIPWQDENKETEEALQRAIKHMTKGTTLEKHNVSCVKCWNYYHEMKQKYCF